MYPPKAYGLSILALAEDWLTSLNSYFATLNTRGGLSFTEAVLLLSTFVQLGPSSNPKFKFLSVGPKLTLNLAYKPPSHPHKLVSHKGLS